MLPCVVEINCSYLLKDIIEMMAGKSVIIKYLLTDENVIRQF